MKVILIDKRDITREPSNTLLACASLFGSKKELDTADTIAIHDVDTDMVELVKSRNSPVGSKMSLPIFSIRAFDGSL